MRKRITKKGWNTSRRFRPLKFRHINIEDTDLAFHKGGGFVYDKEKEKEKLYNAQPCFYTDDRLEENDSCNFYKSVYLYQAKGETKHHVNDWMKVNRNPKRKRKQLSLKACIRRANKVKGVPRGTMITFGVQYYYPGRTIDLNYRFKHKGSEHKIEYEITESSFSKRFTDDEKANAIVDRLRHEGFIIRVYTKNTNILYGESEGEICIGYGYGKMFGFSTQDNPFRGYDVGCNNILFDKFGEFDKWSRCTEIPKDTPIDEVVNILKSF